MSFTKTPAAGSVIAMIVSGTTYTNIPGVEGIPEFGPSKSEYENTAINDTAKTYGADLPDPGDMTIVGSFDLRDSTHAKLVNSAANALSTDQFKVTYASGTFATFNAKVMSFRTSGNKGADEKFSSRLKLTGAVSYTSAT